jgi:hypothetical protein
MFESVLRVMGDSPGNWKRTSHPVKERHQIGKDYMSKGQMKPDISLMFYSRIFFPDKAGNLEILYGLENDILNLPKENLDEVTRRALKMAEGGL